MSTPPKPGFMLLSVPVVFETNSATPDEQFTRLLPSWPTFHPQYTNVTIVTHCGTREKSGTAEARAQALRAAVVKHGTPASIESKPAACADDAESLQGAVIITMGSPSEPDDPLPPGVTTRLRVPFETNSTTLKGDSEPVVVRTWELIASEAKQTATVTVLARCSAAEAPAIAKGRAETIRAKLLQSGVRSDAVTVRQEACAGAKDAQLVEVQVRRRT